MRRTIRITVITLVIIAIGIVTAIFTPGILKVGTNVYSNTYFDTPEDALRDYYDEIKLEKSLCKAETDETCLFLYFNGQTVNVCELIKKDGKYCYFGEKIKYLYNSDFMCFDENPVIINNDLYYFDVLYANRKYLVRNKDYRFEDFEVDFLSGEHRSQTFVYKTERVE